MSSEVTSTSWFSDSDTSSKETSPCSFIVSSPTELSTSAVSKSALEGFVKSAAVELAKENVQINCLSPGFVDSSYSSDFKLNKKELYKWTLEQTPMGRWGSCEEIAKFISFLISKENSYMTGSILYCDGGWTAK